jgi:hypothetical protein
MKEEKGSVEAKSHFPPSAFILHPCFRRQEARRGIKTVSGSGGCCAAGSVGIDRKLGGALRHRGIDVEALFIGCALE